MSIQNKCRKIYRVETTELENEAVNFGPRCRTAAHLVLQDRTPADRRALEPDVKSICHAPKCGQFVTDMLSRGKIRLE